MHSECTTAIASELLKVKDRRARNILAGLVKKKMLQKSGTARKTVYLAGDGFSGLVGHDI